MMNAEQVKTHGVVMMWFIQNSDKGVWYKAHKEVWSINYEPLFDPSSKYVQNDEYAEFRKAQADGKIIQYTKLMSIVDKLEDYIPEDLCIKPDEPKFKVGDWVATTGRPFLVDSSVLSDIVDNQFAVIKPWRPQEGEIACFTSETGVVLARVFEVLPDGEVTGRSLWDESNIYSFDVKPLEFAQTLKDKR